MAPEISVVILCYKAGKRAYGFVERACKLLDNFTPSWEVVLVGNYVEGSEDDTPEVVKDIASGNENVKALTLPKEGMMGWDARSGLSAASGKYVCLIDGDEQMPPGDIIRVYRKISRDDLDLVKTYRARRHDGVARITISFIYNILFKILFPGITARDMNSKPKIIRKDVLERMSLVSDDWFLDAEMMIQARKLKVRIGEVPTKFYKCSYRGSFVKPGTLFEFLGNLYNAKIREWFS